MSNNEFNQQKYIQEYNKKHYKTFKVDLKKEEFDELNELLKEKNLTKAKFLRDAIEKLKKKTRFISSLFICF